MPDLHPEDPVPGLVVRHTPTRSVTEMDDVLFSGPARGPRPLLADFAAAAKPERGTPPEVFRLARGLPTGLSVRDATLGGRIGYPDTTDAAYPAPVFHGDTIRVETEVVSARISKSRTDPGIVAILRRADEPGAAKVAGVVVKSS